MSTILVWKEQLQNIYAKHSKIIIWATQFMMGLFVFGFINTNVGFIKQYATIPYTIALAALCTFLPLTIMLLCASSLILIHLYALALPLAVVMFAVFLIMYIVYFRFTPKMSWLILLTPVAFALKVPFVISIAFGLLGYSTGVIPVAFGTIIYYMLNFIKMNASAYKGGEGHEITESIMIYFQQMMSNKEMWVMVVAMVVGLLVVYAIHKSSVAHSWKLASAFGAATAVIIGTAGNIGLNTKISYISMVLGGVAAILTGLILEILFFAVDYAQTETLQFEDDEYYYYVKAVPKLGVAVPKVSVKHINERKEIDDKENEAIEFEKNKEMEEVSMEEETNVEEKATMIIESDEVSKILEDQIQE